jgi:hypothetical protein
MNSGSLHAATDTVHSNAIERACREGKDRLGIVTRGKKTSGNGIAGIRKV